VLEEWLDPGRASTWEEESRAALAGRLAVQGGQLALERFEDACVSSKPDGSMLTDVDVAVQQLLEKEILARFPDDGVVSEEGLLRPAAGGRQAFWWILDPIDGTNNFGRGLPGFAVSVGVVSAGYPVAGAVYDPFARWLFRAASGEGAWLNGRRLRLMPEALDGRSLFAIRAPYDDDGPPAYVQRWLGRYRLRRFGSVALQLCYVALGALAFVHDQKVVLWDVAGALPVLLEAGALVTNPDGASLLPLDAFDRRPFGLLAGNPLAHRQARRDISA